MQLTRSYRYDAHSGIGAPGARDQRRRRRRGAGDARRRRRRPGVALVEPARTAGSARALRLRRDARTSAPICAARDAGASSCARWSASASSARTGAARDGVEAVNAQIERRWRDAGRASGSTAPSYVGRPIMVTRNDYQLELFNGDVGRHPRRRGEAERRQARASSPPTAACAALSPARLPPHETVFAMSVHKSQGSEFDEVAVLLPPRSRRRWCRASCCTPR